MFVPMKSTFNGAVPYRRVTRLEVVGDAVKETTYTMSTNKPSVLIDTPRDSTACGSELEAEAV